MGTAKFIVSGGSADMKSCSRVACPANSTEAIVAGPSGSFVPDCNCNAGFTGSLTWSPVSATWGTCTFVGCPAHSSGHPFCLCDAGYQGSIEWLNGNFIGNCAALNTTPTWSNITKGDIKSAICRRIQGALSTLASANADSTELDFSFGGNQDSVNILRCELKLDTEFTKISGSFVVTPTARSPYWNSQQIVSWNSTASTPTSGYIGVGTPYDIVEPGGKTDISLSTVQTLTIAEKAVTQTDTIRIEIHQPAGVSLALTNMTFQAYTIPTDVVKCVRTVTTNGG
jgi:hypothetical protein